MSLKLGTLNIAGLSERTKYNAHSLLDFKWTDHILNEVSWLRADTFSWQSGLVYVAAYNALVSDITGATSITETIAGTEITYYRTSTGRKICLPAQEANVLTIYNATGYGWYYILDTTNTRFKLPRNKWGFTGLRDDAGNYVEAGLPNITGTFDYCVTNTAPSGAFYNSQIGGYVAAYSGTGWTTVMDASRSSSIYGNSNTVQPPAVQMYLYFYVGDFSQTATEQTAGLNSELFTGKVDIDLSNVNNTAKSLMANASMPSNTYTDITAGASGTTYTAPADGYYCYNSWVTGAYIALDNYTNGLRVVSEKGSNGGIDMANLLPVKKGDIITLGYDGTWSPHSWQAHPFIFVYAQGDV